VVERQPYSVVEDLGDRIELRRYPAHRVVSVDVNASLEDAGSLGFGPLVRYISGANRSGERIAMTSPVLLEPHNPGSHRVSFVLPEQWWGRVAPVPTATGVLIEDRPAGTMAAIRFRGWWRSERVRSHEEQLRAALSSRGIPVIGAALYARYDPPSVPGPLRRNEILLPVSPQR